MEASRMAVLKNFSWEFDFNLRVLLEDCWEEVAKWTLFWYFSGIEPWCSCLICRPTNGSAKYLFFGKCFNKKLLNIFSNFFSYLKVQSFRLMIENNFIQMAASAGHAVAYMIVPLFKHIIDCVQLYFTNGFTNIVL